MSDLLLPVAAVLGSNLFVRFLAGIQRDLVCAGFLQWIDPLLTEAS